LIRKVFGADAFKGSILPDQPVIVAIADDEEVQDILEDALTRAGFELVTAESGEEAIALFRSGRVAYQVAVIDVGPQSLMNGWAIARQAREINPLLPIIYIGSASADEWRAHGVPASVLLRTPFVPAQMVSAVCNLLNMDG
jgi:DNA-binding response OmpR family regulator